MKTKRCSACQEVKELSEFNKDKQKNDGKQTRCKKCASTASIKSYHKNKDKNLAKKKEYRDKVGKEYFEERHLVNTYGITRKERNDMLITQNHKCDICGIDEINATRGKLFVDHDHKTNKVRALLCHNCNTLVGHCKESEDILLKAIQYLRKHKE